MKSQISNLKSQIQILKLKKTLVLIVILIVSFIFSASIASAQDRGVVEGQKIFEKLQKKEISCSSLKNNDFEKLGDYYMDQMMGKNHESMDEQIEKLYGKDGLKSMHIVMGKRMSGCETGGMSMMGGGGFGMMGPWGYPSAGSGSMMGWGQGGFGLFWFFSLAFWVLILVILALFAVWLWKQIQKK